MAPSLLNVRGPRLSATSYDCYRNIRTIIPADVNERDIPRECGLIENDVTRLVTFQFLP